LRYESQAAIKLSPLAVGPVASGTRPWEQSSPIALYELANFAMHFHRRGVE
jgi:hypothetical protein